MTSKQAYETQDTHFATHCPFQTRMQGTKASQYKSTFDCFKQIVTKEGFAALYAGVVPRLGRVVPGQGIIFMSFESIQNSLATNFVIFQ
jgi:solute carrier family 25 (mitochondrial citrate transporter), member 1